MRGGETWGGVIHDLACNVRARGDELSILLPRLCAGDADMENAVRSLLVGTLDAWRTRGSTLTHFEQAGRRCDGSIELLPGSAFVEPGSCNRTPIKSGPASQCEGLTSMAESPGW